MPLLMLLVALSAPTAPLKRLHCAVPDAPAARQLTGNDVLWLARAIHGETDGKPSRREARAMVWALGQRLCFDPVFHDWSPAKLVQRYSQPVNVKWTRRGPKCGGLTDAEVSALPRSHPCAAHRFPRRARYRRLAWSQLAPAARRAALRFAQGRLKNPVPGYVGWFERRLWRRQVKRGAHRTHWERPVRGKRIADNVFYQSRTRTRRWTGKEVRIR